MTITQAIALHDALSALSDHYWYMAEMALSQENYKTVCHYRALQLEVELRRDNLNVFIIVEG